MMPSSMHPIDLHPEHVDQHGEHHSDPHHEVHGATPVNIAAHHIDTTSHAGLEGHHEDINHDMILGEDHHDHLHLVPRTFDIHPIGEHNNGEDENAEELVDEEGHIITKKTT